jgi:hypothetical protein
MIGSFSEKSISESSELMGELFSLDFARCQRPTGKIYGTRFKCRPPAVEIGAKIQTQAPAKDSGSRGIRVGKTVNNMDVEGLEKLLKDPRVKPHQAKKIQDLIDRKRGDGDKITPKVKSSEGAKVEKPYKKAEEPIKPQIGGELVGDTSQITGGLPRKKIEERIKGLEENKKKYPDSAEIIDFDLERLNKELDKFKSNEKILEGVVANVPAGTKVTVNSKGYIETEFVTNSGHKVKTLFGKKNFNFQVNDTWDAGTVKDRKEQIGVANVVRRTYGALVKSLPEGAVVTTKAWTEDGRGQSRMDAYIKMGFSRPKMTKYGEEIDGLPGMNQYAKKSDGKMVPSTSSEEGLDQTYMFKEKDSEISLWYTAIFGRGA